MDNLAKPQLIARLKKELMEF